MKFLLAVFIIGTTSLNVFAVNIKGVVRAAGSGENIIGATVMVKGGGRGTVSGLDGSFVLSVSSLPVTLSCSYVGYKSQEVTISKPSSALEFTLEPVNTRLDEVVVSHSSVRNTDNSARSIERLSMNVVNVVSAKAIELSPDMTVANVIQRVSGVTVERNNSGDGQYALLRGMDKRYSYTLVNGIKIPSPDNKNRFVPLDIFPAELLDRLEVSKALTADMEADAVGGAVNLVMKDAPSNFSASANIATGYNALFFDRDFSYFDRNAVQRSSPYEKYGELYAAKPRDFSSKTIDQKYKRPDPNLFGGLSAGGRLFHDRLGLMFAGSYQNSYRGSNSLLFESANATSDASNLPVLKSKNDRQYSEQQTRYGLHAKVDYRFSDKFRVQLYNAYMDFVNAQVRDIKEVDLAIGYDPQNGNYNQSFDTRFRLTHQTIYSSTLKGLHLFFNNALKVDWSGVYSRAFNEQPDNASVHTVGTVRNGVQNPTSVVTLGGADRRWEHNSDEDKAGYLNAKYTTTVADAKADFSIGGLYRQKKRDNFFNQYDFRPFDESKPAGSQNNLIKGVDWNSYSDIKFTVFTPYGSVGNPLNYDASEKIAAGYAMASVEFGKAQAIVGIRAEHTSQGYFLKYPTDGVKNEGAQDYIDWLPSVQIKYVPMQNANIRASFFKSINRPSFFEIVPYRIINEDYTERGNPDLMHTVAYNADMRFEFFPSPSEQFMLGVFYKKLENPIEYGMVTEAQGTYFMPTNFGDATNYGMELDITKYFRWVGIKANYTYTKSKIKTSKLENIKNPDPNSSENIIVRNVEQVRPLNGQSEHVFNISLLLKSAKSGWDGQVSYSFTGERIYAVSRYVNDDIWQAGYSQLDASVEKKFKLGISIFAKASNLLDTPMLHYVKKQNPINEAVVGYQTYKNGTMVRRDYYGQNFQLGFRFKL